MVSIAFKYICFVYMLDEVPCCAYKPSCCITSCLYSRLEYYNQHVSDRIRPPQTLRSRTTDSRLQLRLSHAQACSTLTISFVDNLSPPMLSLVAVFSKKNSYTLSLYYRNSSTILLYLDMLRFVVGTHSDFWCHQYVEFPAILHQ